MPGSRAASLLSRRLLSGQLFGGAVILTGMNPPPSQSTAAVDSAKAVRGGKFDSPEQEVFLNLWRTYDRLKLLEDDTFGRFNLSAQQYNALRILRSVHPGSMPTLALGTRLISRAPDMTRMLDKLEQRELLFRERKPKNRRVVEVSITAKGLALLDELDEPVRECHRRQLGHLSRTAMRDLSKLLRAAREPHEDPDNPSIVDP
ncbi:MarR family winged helix-turn-helix transcriptional regulator [Candidatus Laterigemmans baculatus]|uniref:MarR family winged helix-turn-helix transcriptional regulator n=1 Tax=Candidatus Laterigemmans baculatus TaxID=2770505 RepID=UPI001F2E8B03|nr:MarR family transcriptional regulator [Candidatus Laterigemmans baculatus]